jgi:hypothetical protein
MNEFNPFSLLNKIIKDVSGVNNLKTPDAQNLKLPPTPFGAQMPN